MIDYGVTLANVMSVFPDALKADERVLQLGEAVANALVDEYWDMVMANLYGRIDELPEDVLDIIAKDFRINWYDIDAKLEHKRTLIKSSMYYMKHIGTKDALKYIVGSFYSDAEIKEWFEYGGQPYHYKLVTISDEFFDATDLPKLSERLKAIANVRSHLDGMSVGIKAQSDVYVGTASILSEKQKMRVTEVFDGTSIVDFNADLFIDSDEQILEDL